jgi:hypothetical protein
MGSFGIGTWSLELAQVSSSCFLIHPKCIYSFWCFNTCFEKISIFCVLLDILSKDKSQGKREELFRDHEDAQDGG